MRTTLPLLVLAACCLATPTRAAEATTTGVQTVRRRILETLIPTPDARRDVAGRARRLVRALQPDGLWPDVDYTDRDPASWKPSAHARNLVTLAKAYRAPGQDLAGNAELLAKIRTAFDAWVRLDPRCPNWWYNEIGVPMMIGDFAILMGDDLSAPQRAAAVEILKRSKWARWTGQNLVWGTSVQIVRGCLEDSPAVVREAYDRMYREIRIAADGEEGVQADYSFHQHGALLYSGGYGAGFSLNSSYFIELADGTSLVPPPEARRILESYLLDGQQWMIRGRVFDYGVTGRELTRPGKNAASLATAAERMARLGGPRAAEMAAFARRLSGKGTETPISGNRHFWRSDYMAHHRAGYFASVRMFSTRLLSTDGFINGENKKSHHLADGANLLYRTGEEYRDIFPVWDWLRVPGTTCQQNTPLVPREVNHRGATTFVGGVSDGVCGAAAMHLATGKLEARKAWFFFDDVYACLGAGISCPTDNAVLTSVNQCRLAGPVTISGQNDPMPEGERQLSGPAWVHHDSVGYVFPRPAAVHVARRAQTGAWSDIGVGSSKRIGLDVFSLWLDHGARPDGAGYEYVVLPGIDAKTTADRAASLPVVILANTPKLQAVSDRRSNRIGAVFAAPAALESQPRIAVDQPCLVLASRAGNTMRIAVSNPENKPLTVEVEIGLALDGAETTAAGNSRVRFDLPGGLDAGRSVVREWTLK
ncbi:MAG: polysaccharide lyase 8 family protein [Pirellulales bacterium]